MVSGADYAPGASDWNGNSSSSGVAGWWLPPATCCGGSHGLRLAGPATALGALQPINHVPQLRDAGFHVARLKLQVAHPEVERREQIGAGVHGSHPSVLSG